MDWTDYSLAKPLHFSAEPIATASVKDKVYVIYRFSDISLRSFSGAESLICEMHGPLTTLRKWGEG